MYVANPDITMWLQSQASLSSHIYTLNACMRNNQSSGCRPKYCYNQSEFFSPTIIVFMIDHRCHGRVLNRCCTSLIQIGLSSGLPQRKLGTEGDVLLYASFPRTHQLVFSLVNGHATFHVFHPMNGCSPCSSPLFEQASRLSLWLWNNCPHCPNAIPC